MAPVLSDETARELAASLFNHAWTYIVAANRSPDDDERMIDAAHASAHFWRDVGKPENWVRSQWQLARVYAVAGRAEPALHHARRSLALCETYGIAGFDRPFAYEALARAHALAGDAEHMQRCLAQARALSSGIDDDHDRSYLLDELATIVLHTPPDEPTQRA
jgi:hypothetical protein